MHARPYFNMWKYRAPGQKTSDSVYLSVWCTERLGGEAVDVKYSITTSKLSRRSTDISDNTSYTARRGSRLDSGNEYQVNFRL